MNWTQDPLRSLIQSDDGYQVRKVTAPRGAIYRTFTPTGGFLGAAGERIDAEQLCERHKEKEDGFVITPIGSNEK